MLITRLSLRSPPTISRIRPLSTVYRRSIMSSQKPLLVAVVGVGLVGSEFISQLLSIPSPSPFKLISLTSSTRTLTLASSASQLKSEWKSLLSSSSLPADLQSLTQRLTTLVSQDKERVILVDNTSSDAVAALYPTWLAQGINVVTPNKKAYSGDAQLWKNILDASNRQGGGRYLNEATVGAGLPVISTLKELLGTGDRIIKIEGVFSGTMSYIFNEFSTGSENGPAFSTVVSVAREKGYTVCYPPLPLLTSPILLRLHTQEPHPADDLNGFDVARKLTILSRIISSFPSSSSLPTLQSFASVKTASLIPPELEGIPTGDEFLARLPTHDAQFAKLREEASKEGKVLRFVGVVDVQGGEVRAGLEK